MAEREDLSKLEGEKNPFNKYEKKYTSLKVWLITLASFVVMVALFFIAKGLLPYTLTFDTLGGSAVQSQKLTFLEIMKAPDEIPTKSGYYFDGWTKDKANKKPFPFGDKIWWSTTAYAKWNDGVAIVLEFAEGEENEDLSTAELKALHEVWLKPGSSFELTSVVNTKQGSLHYGERLVWFEDKDCTGDPIIFSKTYSVISESITVYGKWFDFGEEGSYEVDENGVLTNYTGYCKNLMLPANVKSIRSIDVDIFMSTNDGVNMKDEAQSVFKNVMSSVESIYLNDGLEDIGECAFKNCTKLKKVTFTNGVSHSSLKTIGGHAFKGTKISTFDIPATTTTIGEYAFHGITELVSVNLGGVKTLGKCAFADTSLEEVTLKNVERLAPMAFAGCNSLKKMYLLSPSKIEIDGVNSNSENVLMGSGNAFNFKIYILKSLKSAYSSDPWWGMYSDKFIEYTE